jgi:hypothetical protein
MRLRPPPATPLPKATPLYLGLTALALVVSVLKTPRFPVSDPALFEYFGRALLHGGKLYAGDLVDNKLPSIYLVNELWQALFGSNYVLHAWAEGAVNLGAIALFAVALRKAGVATWPFGTLLFAAFFCLPYPYFDTVYHYGVFFIVLGVCLAFCDRNVLAGASIAVATTFCFPAALTCVPILALRPRERRLPFLLGFAGFFVVGAAAMLLAFGPHVFTSLANQWRTYVVRTDWSDMLQHGSVLFASGMGAGILAMLALLLLVARRPIGDASRFALIWSACAFFGFVISPQFVTDRFLLPSTPALAMAIASFSPSRRDMMRRPLVALVVLALLMLTSINTVRDADKTRHYANYAQAFGNWIRASAGSGRRMFVRDWAPEIALASDAVMLRRYDDAGHLVVQPTAELLVFGPFEIPQAVREGADLVITSDGKRVVFRRVCPDVAAHPAFCIIYARFEIINKFSCKGEPPA